MVAGWMSDEEDANERDDEGGKIIKVVRPAFRSEQVMIRIISIFV